ncbi:cellulose synthase [Microbispora sp. NBC_01189]|uniref:cellulose synthase n=1 Tax=Microbispora sp. NBC_01189 TaxID=2903583 RepID=UPI002E11832E|nr:cellulose synthase [Microbispora sp. NBC_01189]
MNYNDIAWLPVCGGLTAVGLVLTYLAFRRRGAAAGLRAAAWSLLPLAAYLTGAQAALWTIGTAAVSFVTGLVLSPLAWAGVAVAGLSAVLFVVSGAMRGRSLARARTARPGAAEAAPAAAPTAGTPTAGTPKAGTPKAEAPKKVQTAKAAPRQVEQAAADDFSEIEDILKRRGIG